MGLPCVRAEGAGLSSFRAECGGVVITQCLRAGLSLVLRG